MLPDSDNKPAILTQHLVHPPIASLVFQQLAAPPAGVCLWLRSMSPAAVPEAAIDKDGHLLIAKNEVRHSSSHCITDANPNRHVPTPTPNSHTPKGFRYTHFRGCVAGPPHGGHYQRSFPLREYVCHN